MSVCLSVCLFVCLSECLSICLSVCQVMCDLIAKGSQWYLFCCGLVRNFAVNPSAPIQRLLDQQVPAGFIQVEERAMEVARECRKHGEVPVLTTANFK